MHAAKIIQFPQRQSGFGRSGRGMEDVALAEGVNGQGSAARTDEMSTLLVAVAERQDKAAFAELFRHFAPRVKSYLMRFGDGGGRAEEVTQETFVAVWTRAATYDPAKASAATWIFTIARNRRIDAFRRERRPEFDPNDPAFVPEQEPEGEDVVTARERKESLEAALAELSEEQREVLRLSFFEDHSHDVIAEKLGLPVGTVKSRIRLAYGHLRSRLAAKAGGLL